MNVLQHFIELTNKIVVVQFKFEKAILHLSSSELETFHELLQLGEVRESEKGDYFRIALFPESTFKFVLPRWMHESTLFHRLILPK